MRPSLAVACADTATGAVMQVVKTKSATSRRTGSPRYSGKSGELGKPEAAQRQRAATMGQTIMGCCPRDRTIINSPSFSNGSVRARALLRSRLRGLAGEVHQVSGEEPWPQRGRPAGTCHQKVAPGRPCSLSVTGKRAAERAASPRPVCGLQKLRFTDTHHWRGRAGAPTVVAELLFGFMSR